MIKRKGWSISQTDTLVDKRINYYTDAGADYLLTTKVIDFPFSEKVYEGNGVTIYKTDK